MHSLKSVLNIRWQYRVTNLEVLDRADTTDIEAMILKEQLHWTEHVIWMDASRMPKQLLFGKLTQGNRNQGRPQKYHKECEKISIVSAGLNPKQLEICVKDQIHWCMLTKTVYANFET